MIKLTYTKPGDEMDSVTVLGSEAGILDLWFRLGHAQYEYTSHGFGTVRITNLDGLPIDPKKGLRNTAMLGTELGRERL